MCCSCIISVWVLIYISSTNRNRGWDSGSGLRSCMRCCINSISSIVVMGLSKVSRGASYLSFSFQWSSTKRKLSKQRIKLESTYSVSKLLTSPLQYKEPNVCDHILHYPLMQRASYLSFSFQWTITKPEIELAENKIRMNIQCIQTTHLPLKYNEPNACDHLLH